MSAPPKGIVSASPAPSVSGKPAASATAARPSGPESLWTKLRRRPHPLTSVAFTVPVFLVYHLGVLLIPRRSQVDFVSTLVLRLLDASVPAYVMGTLAVALMLLLIVWVQQKRGAVPASSFGRVLLEATGCALLLLTSVGWATHQLFSPSEAGALSTLNVPEKLLLATGSGFHEEFLFRALLISGGSWLLGKLSNLNPRVALIICMLGSAVVSALVQTFLMSTEPFTLLAAAYRALEGLLFAILYVTRGFAVTVYGHVFYDALCFFVYA
jgi:membrane protease YdiL (CAAX protease family)